ncbi:hypothetical protein LuPra_01272 [Luteitalea pratensis]|jgi:hypothetical protein|uniref:Uncharacterized protein n=1 Tax=Luteitalea pratensis TaxID=1855912 RepID=A0A143PJX8_LUTPR|nr:hypothetical protein [Luteitalea pratensis]AMY08084.1 hypothetical protein LuPra_01272 [Luteitalea pratensis]
MTMEPDDLERLAHRALADLPMPRAPRTFRPRVMAALALPDVGHPWFTWPWPLQVAAVLLVAAVVGGFGWAWPTLLASFGALLPHSLQTGAGYVGGAAETTAALLRVMELTWSAVVAPIARLVLLLTVALCTACALCLAALSRVALGGASQS